MTYNKANKTYNNIEDISTPNLLKMLEIPKYKDYKKMIEDELRFRNEGLSFNKMIDVFKGGA